VWTSCTAAFKLLIDLATGPASQAELSQWRSKLAASGREWTERNGGLRVQVHTLRRHCSDLRAGMARFQADHDSDLRQLCVERWAARPWHSKFAGQREAVCQGCDQTLYAANCTCQPHTLCLALDTLRPLQEWKSLWILVCCSNTQQQRLQQQLATAQRLLKMVALCSDMAQQHVRTAASRLPNTIVALGVALSPVPTVCVGWYLFCSVSASRVNKVHMGPCRYSSWACRRSRLMIAACQTMRQACNSRVHRRLRLGCLMPQCSSCTR
jgi:hypothetical protein